MCCLQQAAGSTSSSKRDAAMTGSIHMHVVCVIDLVRGKDSKDKNGSKEGPIGMLVYAEVEKACEWSVCYRVTWSAD